MSHEHERAFSASLIYLGLGALAALGIEVLDIAWVDPLGDAKLIEHVAEVALIFALFSSGLKLDRRLRWREWSSVARLLAIAMPLTMAGVALFATQAMGLTLGAALLLGAILSPTDPVLAGDIGVGPPGDEDEHEPNFALTAEAGGNDGLAAPLVLLGVFVAEQGGTGWFGEWLVAGLLYACAAGVLIGAGNGWAAGSGGQRLGGGLERALAARPGAARTRLRRLPRRRHRADHLRPGRGGGRLRLPGRVRQRPGLPPLRARPRAQRARPPGRRAGREVHGAGGDPPARLAALQRRAERARVGRLGARARAACRDPPARDAGVAARRERRDAAGARVRCLVRRARRRHPLLRGDGGHRRRARRRRGEARDVDRDRVRDRLDHRARRHRRAGVAPAAGPGQAATRSRAGDVSR